MDTRRPRGVLKIKRKGAVGAIGRSKLMEKGFGDNVGLFPNPNPALSVFSNQIVLTDKAQVLAIQGGKGAAALRDVQLGLLVGMMTSELVYAQSVADAGNPDQATATLHAAGVEVAAFSQYQKPVLQVMAGATTGSVVLVANATVLLAGSRQAKHFFCWEYTTDGKSYLGMPSTPEAVTTLAGLTPLTTVGFRVAVTRAKGILGAWSPTIEFLIR